MSGEIDLIGTFDDEIACAHAIEALNAANVRTYRAFYPIPSEHIWEAVGKGRSPVRGWVLAGGITGVIGAFALTVGTSLEWNIVAGGKPIASIAPYIIIAFELMILTGGIFGVLGFLYKSGLPPLDFDKHYQSRFAQDRFGLIIRCNENEVSRIEAILRQQGAEEITREAA